MPLIVRSSTASRPKRSTSRRANWWAKSWRLKRMRSCTRATLWRALVHWGVPLSALASRRCALASAFSSARKKRGLAICSPLDNVAIFGSHRLQPLRHPFGIAMLAAMADLRATSHRIPRSLGPFDFGARGHIYKSFRICSAIRLAGPIPFGFPTQNRNSNNAEFFEFFSVRD